jgi:hypothetical protein
VTEEEAVAIAETQAAERQAAARQYQTAGHADRANRLLREAQAIRSVLENIGHAKSRDIRFLLFLPPFKLTA